MKSKNKYQKNEDDNIKEHQKKELENQHQLKKKDDKYPNFLQK
jgi:hypothetical protein